MMKTSHDRPQKLRLIQNSFKVGLLRCICGKAYEWILIFFSWVHITYISMIQGGKFDELFFRIRNAKTQKTWLSEEASIWQEIMVEEERKMEAMGAAPGESGASGPMELAMAVKTNCSHCTVNTNLQNKKDVWSLKEAWEIRCYCK